MPYLNCTGTILSLYFRQKIFAKLAFSSRFRSCCCRVVFPILLDSFYSYSTCFYTYCFCSWPSSHCFPWRSWKLVGHVLDVFFEASQSFCYPLWKPFAVFVGHLGSLSLFLSAILEAFRCFCWLFSKLHAVSVSHSCCLVIGHFSRRFMWLLFLLFVSCSSLCFSRLFISSSFSFSHSFLIF